MRKAMAAAALLTSLIFGPASAQQPNGAEQFVDPVSVRNVRLSPSGAYVAYIERVDAGGEERNQVVVVDLASRSATTAQSLPEEDGSINWLSWKDDDRLIIEASLKLTMQGQNSLGSHVSGSDQHYAFERVVAVNRDGSNFVQMFQGEMRHLYYGFGSMSMLDVLPNDPTHILLNATGNSGIGVWRADTTTGHAEQLDIGNDHTLYFLTDGTGSPVIRVDLGPSSSSLRYYRRAHDARAWTFITEAHKEDVNTPDFDLVVGGPAADQVYVLARPDNRDLAALYLYNTSTGAFGEPLQTSGTVDASAPWLNLTTHELIATCEEAQRLTCQTRDPHMQRHLRAIDSFFHHQADIQFVNTSADGKKWLLYVEGPLDPGAYFIYEPDQAHIEPIAQTHPSIHADTLSPTEVVTYQSRDGASLWAYVTARPGQNGPRPTVVMPHGGPEARDSYGFDSFAQFLAARGYVVVQPNFRGSAGFGRAFSSAGYGQWGKRMQDDVTDAVHHMIDAGVADPHRICIVGASYGGYAALAGLALTPDLYRCGISIAGVADLSEAVRAESSSNGHAGLGYQYWAMSIGDPGRDHVALDAVSPRRHADKVTAPLLLIHGEDDDIVPIRQSELMQQALAATGHAPRFVRIPDEDHHWDTWSREHRLTLYNEVGAFLAQNLPVESH